MAKIRLTESELRKMIRKSVRSVLMEANNPSPKRAAFNDMRDENGETRMRNKANKTMNKDKEYLSLENEPFDGLDAFDSNQRDIDDAIANDLDTLDALNDYYNGY